MKIHSDILALADLYDVFFVDVYGVLFNGVGLYDGALLALEELKRAGKKIIILSNTTELAESAKVGYSRRGLICDMHYDLFLTSGEFVHRSIKNSTDVLTQMAGHRTSTVKCLFLGNGEIFQDTAITKVNDIDEADFLYVGVPRASTAICLDEVRDENGNFVSLDSIIDIDWHKTSNDGLGGLRDIVHDLDVCLAHGKTLLVANPDLFAYCGINGKRHPILTQGAVGCYYEKMGGKVMYFGKPYRGIFDFAKSFVSNDASIAMVGDTPWTDICGANNAGIDSILVTTGVASSFSHQENGDQQGDIEYLLNVISPRMNHSGITNVIPTHVIRQFGRKRV